MSIIPEWVWMIIVGTVIIGLIKALWGSRNKGILSIRDHIDLCLKAREAIGVDIDRITKSFSEALITHSKNMTDLLNSKFDSLDDKIENKIFKQIRSMKNGRA
jgi:hypothetical protein